MKQAHWKAHSDFKKNHPDMKEDIQIWKKTFEYEIDHPDVLQSHSDTLGLDNTSYSDMLSSIQIWEGHLNMI